MGSFCGKEKMIVYEDIVTGDQVLSDSHPQIPLKINIGGQPTTIPGMFTVQSKLVVKGPVQVNTGANASKEEQEEELADNAVKVVDIKDPELGFGYEGPGEYDEADFQGLFKKWCKTVKEKIEAKGAKPKDFMQAAKAFHPAIKENFSTFEM